MKTSQRHVMSFLVLKNDYHDTFLENKNINYLWMEKVGNHHNLTTSCPTTLYILT